MFKNLINLIEIDLSKFDFSKVKKMNSMFNGCNNLTKIFFGKINTSLVTDMSGLFENCYKLISIDLSNFNTSLVTTMRTMFSHCKNIEIIDASSFNTSKVEIMFDLFAYCDKLVAVNVSNFDTSKVSIFQGIFYCSDKIKYLDLRNFKAASVESITFMFGFCKSLIYLNLYNFKIQTNLSLQQTFEELPQDLKYCVKDNFTENYFSKQIDKKSNCSDSCFKENIKIDPEKNLCLEKCNNEQFEYYGICFKKCPEYTFKLFTDRKLCYDKIPENFYLDSSEDIFKECYQTCKKCKKKGEEENNNCDECITNFIFLNDSSVNKKNCYQKCKFYYYINEENEYMCTSNDSCPENFNKLIPERNKCIDDCKKDDYYIYEFNNSCLEKCPNGTKSNNETNICEKELLINMIFTTNYIDNINNTNYTNLIPSTQYVKVLTDEDEIILDLKESIMNGNLDDIIKNITETKRDYVIKKENIIYQITTTENQNFTTNNEISKIDLLECEYILKEKYDINKTLPLIILKVDYNTSETLIPLVGYEVYHPLNKLKLDLSYCNNSIILKVPASVDENKLFINDPNSDFYNDNCFSYTTENGTDIIISDRKQEFIDNNLSLCEINCSYITYDLDNKQSSCFCYIKNNIELISEMVKNPNKLSNNISVENNDTSSLNIKTMKCTKELFSKDGLKNNISSYILLIFIFFFLLSIILFMKCGYRLLEEDIEQILNKIKIKYKVKKNNNNNKNHILKRGSKAKHKRSKKNNVNFPPKNKMQLNFSNNIKLNKIENSNINLDMRQIEFSNNENNYKNNKKGRKTKNKKNNFISENNNKIMNKLELNIFELNSLKYEEAIIYDKRECCEYYISLLKVKHPILFSFYHIIDYNSMIIKVCISILSFSFSYAINFLFFDENAIHKIYKDQGKYDFIYFIPKISLSFLVSNFFFVLIKFIFLSERNLIQIRQKKTISEAEYIASKVKRNLVIKYTIFFIFGFIFLSFFWMLLSSFGAVYQNTQIIVFENTLICLGISLVYPFLINILPGLFRIPSLKAEKKDKKCIYNFSKFLQIL